MKTFFSLWILILYCCTGFSAAPAVNVDAMSNDPMEQFQEWLQEAQKKLGALNASVFVLGTVNSSCQPSTRSMIAKSIENNSICFFGDKRSAKFEDITQNPSVSGTFLWTEEKRQVTFMGKAKPVSKAEAQAAFDTLSREAQVAAHVSEQGAELKNFSELEEAHNAVLKQYQSKKVPMPDTWEGYCLEPEVVLFWSGREDGLHYRVMFTREKHQWSKQLLQP